MLAKLNYGWRLVATGLSFSVFGISGLLFSFLVFPLAYVWPHRASRQRVVTAIIHTFFRALVAVLQRIGVMELDTAGVEALRSAGSSIIIANHPTYLDVMVLLALTPSACCVVKNAHWGNPCFWGIVRAFGLLRGEECPLGQPLFLGYRSGRGIREQRRPRRIRRRLRTAAFARLLADHFSGRLAQPRAEQAPSVFARFRLCRTRSRRAGAAGADALRSARIHETNALVSRAAPRVSYHRESARSHRNRAA